MRKGLFAALTLALMLFLEPALAGPASAATPAARPASPFLSSQPCFGRSYDEWIRWIRSKNSAFNPKALLLPLAFPRGEYEAAQRKLDCSAISYGSDGLVITGWMVAPRHPARRKLPVVIFNRGGNGGFGALKFADLFSQVFPLAEQGFLVLASQYRGMSEVETHKYGFDEFGGADVRDVRELMAMVARIPNADPDNVFLFGVSRGVMQSYLAARNQRGIRAMVMVNGSVDLQADLAVRPEMERLYQARMPGYGRHKARRLRERSALAWAEELPAGAPILMMHGTKDERVPPANGPKMKRRLDALGRPNRLIMFEGASHFLDKDKVVAEAVAWFRANLRAPRY